MFYYTDFTMSIWDRFLYLIGLRPKPGPRYYELTESLHTTLSTLAEHEGRPEDELIPDLLAAGLTQYHSTNKTWQQWLSLTPRERDVAALACLGYTNREMANRFGVSLNTVKTHMRNTLAKFEVGNRVKLRQKLADWDFSAWAHWM
jgi:DNA-binding CsgD family transcriptional regulator